jgi:hypothetical protein
MVFASTVFWLQWMDLVVPQFEFDYSLQIAMFTICSDGGVRRIYLFLTYQYGLRPKRHQYRRLEAIPRGQRLLYNAALEERCQAWSKSHKSVTHFEQTKSLTTIRADDPQGYGALPVNLSRWSLKKVDEAFQAFFRRIEAKRGKGGFPRFKSMHRWRSFGFSEFSGIRLIDGALVFKGMPGRLKLHLHRPLPENASIRSCTLTKEGRAWRVHEVGELAQTFNRMIEELHGRDRLKDTFGKFLDPRLVSRLIASGADQAERRSLTIFFSDIKQFTGVSEQLTASTIVVAEHGLR